MLKAIVTVALVALISCTAASAAISLDEISYLPTTKPATFKNATNQKGLEARLNYLICCSFPGYSLPVCL